MVSVAKSLCSGSEGLSRGRPRSEKKSKLASSKDAINFDNEMHLPVKGTRRRSSIQHRVLHLQIGILFKRLKRFFIF
jgi:hypothetical protein